jgi:hypothetical protein
MKDFIKIAVAVLIMAAAVPMRAQEWSKVNDTTYARFTVEKYGVTTEYAEPVDMTALTVKLNNDLRSAALCRAGAFGCGFVAAAAGLGSVMAYNGKSTTLNAAAILFGFACLGLEIGAIDKMYQSRVYIAPDGVAIRLNRMEQPKYDNKLRRK